MYTHKPNQTLSSLSLDDNRKHRELKDKKRPRGDVIPSIHQCRSLCVRCSIHFSVSSYAVSVVSLCAARIISWRRHRLICNWLNKLENMQKLLLYPKKKMLTLCILLSVWLLMLATWHSFIFVPSNKSGRSRTVTRHDRKKWYRIRILYVYTVGIKVGEQKLKWMASECRMSVGKLLYPDRIQNQKPLKFCG